MFRRTPLASAISSATIASSLAAVAPVSALAQDGAGAIEEVVVTGSRIRRADIATASPISVISREEMQLTGMTDIGDLLQSMPSMSGSPIGTTTNNGGNGSVEIDLRGMGPDRTLTLINGQRMVDRGDFQTVPQIMIERVEILKDGASAVYGADAVSGVVNIITRRDFEGFNVSLQNADWFDSEGAQNTIGMIAGSTFDRGNFVFGAEYVDQDEAYQRDVPWDFMQDSYYIYPEGCESNLTAPYPTGCYPIGSSRIPESFLPFYSQDDIFMIGTPASSPYEVGTLEPWDGRSYNYAPVNYLQTPYERTNVFAEGTFQITDTIRFRTELRGSKRESAQELAPLPFTGGDPMHNGFFNGEAYEGVSEENYYLRRAVDAYNAANPTTPLPYEPVVEPRRRMIETNRRFTQDVTQYQVLASLEGEIFEGLRWEVYVNEGYRSRNDLDSGQFSGQRLHDALGPSADLDGDGQPECYPDLAGASEATRIEGCVPLNLFGGGVVDRATGNIVTSTLTQDMIDFVSVDLNDTFTTKQRTAGASLAGDAWELPGGALGWAVGYGHWKQEFTYQPDSAKTIGAATGNVGQGTDGTLENNAFYAEFFAPVFDNGEQSFNATVGVRYDDWDAFDSETTYQVGLEFYAMQDLKLRATGGTIYRAPTIEDLFGGLVDSFPTFSDPCAPAAGEPLPPGCAQTAVQFDTQVHALVGGNPNLQPETGDTVTAGVVWTPTFGEHDLSVTVDYWQIDLEDGISSLGPQFILDDCYVNQNQESCGLVVRNPDYTIDVLFDTDLNVAEQGGEGIDTEVRWSLATDIGEFQASFLWAHMLERTKTAFPGAPEEDLSGRYTDPTAEDGGAYAEDKINYSIRWRWNDLTIGYLGEFISSLDADTFCNCDSDGDLSNNDVQPDGTPLYTQNIDSVLYHDLVFNYAAPYGFTVSGGVTNLTDEEPPYIEVGFNATTDPSTYRLFGRGYYLRLEWQFEGDE